MDGQIWLEAYGRLLNRLSLEEQLALADVFHEVSYARGHPLFDVGDEAVKVYILRRGRVRLYRLSEEGREISFSLVRPGELFGPTGPIDEPRHDLSAETMTQATLAWASAADVARLAALHHGIALEWSRALARRLEEAGRLVERLAVHSITHRLAATLLEVSDAEPLGAGGKLLMSERLTHETLATFIGSVRETTTKALGALEDAGFVRKVGRRVLIDDPSRLRRLLEVGEIDREWLRSPPVAGGRLA